MAAFGGRGRPCPRPGGCRRLAAETKGDVGHLRFPMSPLDTPLTFRWPLSKAFAAKRGLRGLGSVRRDGYIEPQCPEFTLHRLRFDQAKDLSAPDTSVGPSHLAAQPKGVAAQRKVRGVKRGQETILGVLSPFAPVGGHRHPRPPKAANVQPSEGVNLASTGCAAVSAERLTLC